MNANFGAPDKISHSMEQPSSSSSGLPSSQLLPEHLEAIQKAKSSMVSFPPSISSKQSTRGAVSFVFCPNNRDKYNAIPTVGDKVAIRLLAPDLGVVDPTANRQNVYPTGIALQRKSDYRFMGWVQIQDKEVLFERLKAKKWHVRGVVAAAEPFNWAAGGGTCYSGIVNFSIVPIKRMNGRTYAQFREDEDKENALHGKDKL